MIDNKVYGKYQDRPHVVADNKGWSLTGGIDTRPDLSWRSCRAIKFLFTQPQTVYSWTPLLPSSGLTGPDEKKQVKIRKHLECVCALHSADVNMKQLMNAASTRPSQSCCDWSRLQMNWLGGTRVDRLPMTIHLDRQWSCSVCVCVCACVCVCVCVNEVRLSRRCNRSLVFECCCMML